MALPEQNRADWEYRKFKESTSSQGTVGVISLNPDGSDIGSGTSDVIILDGTSNVILMDPAGDPIDIITASFDARASTQNQLITAADVYLYNGSTYDRWRGNTLGANVILTSGTVDSLPARTAGTDKIGGYHQTDLVYNSGTAETPKFANIDFSEGTTNVIVSAVSGKKIRPLYLILMSNGTGTAIVQNAAEGTALIGPLPFVANTGVSTGYVPVGLQETAVGALLNLEIQGTANVGGSLTYVEI